ncbi:general secretory pathway protein L [Burkholderia lata]|uniref:General secretory pathway protein L n=1 Tax=Burkholderia lata (strain ATCC 17760 / DSM 23089 / LMG 22485 / NCIMB 9086 / R18194 / 383) TaxID=482957 RepID=A0A6P2TY33_BURL3|nr:type II secretion system protein GspL [Burkholderia lata]VWC65940.1 general secretory pathway protein L [Burkholderia lata]
MSSLIVLLPSIGHFDAVGWEAIEMPYALFDRRGQFVRAGRAHREAWPKAASTVLVLAARDTLLVDVNLPPVKGEKLRRVLPHAVEEYLIGDAQRSHVAVGPVAGGNAARPVAVVDRERFGEAIRWFNEAGHRRVRAVPLIHCMATTVCGEPADGGEQDDVLPESARSPTSRTLPLPNGDEDVEATVLIRSEADVLIATPPALSEADIERCETDVLIICRPASSEADADADADARGYPLRLELAVKRGSSGFGLETRASALDATIAELSKHDSVRVHALVVEGHDDVEGGSTAASDLRARMAGPSAFPLAARTLRWDALASNALDCKFDLCQFEFARSTSRTDIGGWRRWRIPAGLAIASAIVAITTINVQWFQLRHRQDALNAELTARVKTAFPETKVLLDPSLQMRTGLERLRAAAGELHANDYLVLSASLSRALGPIPSDAIATLDYRDGTLAVAFRPGTAVDGDGFRQRLQAQGVTANEEDAKWMLGSTRPAPR